MNYSYHGRIKQRIKAGELTDVQFVTDYPRIGECMVLVFNTIPIFRPVRPHKYSDYVDILAEWRQNHENRLSRAGNPAAQAQ